MAYSQKLTLSKSSRIYLAQALFLIIIFSSLFILNWAAPGKNGKDVELPSDQGQDRESSVTQKPLDGSAEKKGVRGQREHNGPTVESNMWDNDLRFTSHQPDQQIYQRPVASAVLNSEVEMSESDQIPSSLRDIDINCPFSNAGEQDASGIVQMHACEGVEYDLSSLESSREMDVELSLLEKKKEEKKKKEIQEKCELRLDDDNLDHLLPDVPCNSLTVSDGSDEENTTVCYRPQRTDPSHVQECSVTDSLAQEMTEKLAVSGSRISGQTREDCWELPFGNEEEEIFVHPDQSYILVYKSKTEVHSAMIDEIMKIVCRHDSGEEDFVEDFKHLSKSDEFTVFKYTHDERRSYIIKKVPSCAGGRMERPNRVAVPIRIEEEFPQAVYIIGVTRRGGGQTTDDAYLILMEYCEGGTVASIPAHQWTDGRLLTFIRTLLSDLRVLHSRGIAHGDISAENICLRRRNNVSSLCYIDWEDSEEGREAMLRDLQPIGWMLEKLLKGLIGSGIVSGGVVSAVEILIHSLHSETCLESVLEKNQLFQLRDKDDEDDDDTSDDHNVH